MQKGEGEGGSSDVHIIKTDPGHMTHPKPERNVHHIFLLQIFHTGIYVCKV